MWEFGIHGGGALGFGDIDFQPNWGAGFHIRKAFDYVFSLRGEGLYSVLKFSDNQDGTAETTVMSGSLQMLVSFNNLIWSENPRRKVNLYGLVGGGVTRFEVEAKKILLPYLSSRDPITQTHADFGFGIGFRIAKRLNLGLETKQLILFGSDADLLDGVIRRERDVLSYSSIRLNFNIGNKEKRVEPLYWVNPMENIMQDITELKQRPVFDPTDTDGDGVIDMLDQDNSTPPGVPVDTRGVALDSDGDGIPDYMDDEPYIPAGRKYVTEEEISAITGNQVKNIVSEELDKRKGGDELANWFLPNVHFNIDSDKVRYADYGNLSSIARVMLAHPNLRVVVTGFTDKTASANYNLRLSFRRANSAIQHLVNIHGIPRHRLILNYNGEDFPLVPSMGSSLMNRRVEFRVAEKSDQEMPSP